MLNPGPRSSSSTTAAKEDHASLLEALGSCVRALEEIEGLDVGNWKNAETLYRILKGGSLERGRDVLAKAQGDQP